MTRLRWSNNRGHAVTALASPPLAKNHRSRVCPRCDAPIGWSCRRLTSIGVWTPLVKVHPERKSKKSN